ncbi:MAG: FG-GAP repeat protein [Planctomycetes bacterium]|nr:FG-GAP repeat protein [Planctomycetota bacterium]
MARGEGEPASWAGESVAGAGDVNGDGLADLLVGAPGASPGGRDGAGESYVVFGKPDGAPVELAEVQAGRGGFAIRGSTERDFAGSSVSAAGTRAPGPASAAARCSARRPSTSPMPSTSSATSSLTPRSRLALTPRTPTTRASSI